MVYEQHPLNEQEGLEQVEHLTLIIFDLKRDNDGYYQSACPKA
jgi:hypothetical protein